MLDSVSDLADDSEADALGRLADLNAMFTTAVTRLEKLEDRVTQLHNGVFEQLLEDGINADSDTDSSSESESGQDNRSSSSNSQGLKQDSSQVKEISLAELRGDVEAALAQMPSIATQRLDDMYSALALSLISGCSSR